MGISSRLLNTGGTVAVHTRTHAKALLLPVVGEAGHLRLPHGDDRAPHDEGV